MAFPHGSEEASSKQKTKISITTMVTLDAIFYELIERRRSKATRWFFRANIFVCITVLLVFKITFRLDDKEIVITCFDGDGDVSVE